MNKSKKKSAVRRQHTSKPKKFEQKVIDLTLDVDSCQSVPRGFQHNQPINRRSSKNEIQGVSLTRTEQASEESKEQSAQRMKREVKRVEENVAKNRQLGGNIFIISESRQAGEKKKPTENSAEKAALIAARHAIERKLEGRDYD